MRNEALAYVGQLLRGQREEDKRPGQQFRTRFSHIKRVCMWLDRLLEAETVDNVEALRLAAAFHDVGYLRSEESHGAHSAGYLRAYAWEYGVADAVAERAAFLVTEHSSKQQWMTDPRAPRDLILLMEADLLDEEGAMGIALDCMTAGALGMDYHGAYARMRRFEPSRLQKNPMVTPGARALWAQKQQMIQTFMQAFAYDLGLPYEE